jgi:hypothetical protein
MADERDRKPSPMERPDAKPKIYVRIGIDRLKEWFATLPPGGTFTFSVGPPQEGGVGGEAETKEQAPPEDQPPGAPAGGPGREPPRGKRGG